MVEDDEPVVTVMIPLSIARRISDGLSDIALWCHGFNAALSAEESSRRPWGTDAITDINLRLKNRLDSAERGTLSPLEAENARLRRWLHRITEAGSSKDILRQAAERALAGSESPDGFGLPSNLEDWP